MKDAGTLLLTLILSGFSALRCGATVYSADGTAASVQSVHNNQAQNGDTITLPSGTFTWTSGVTISKQITLQGAGTSVTGGGDQTVIVDNIAANQAIVNFNNSTNTLTVRMTGITVRSGTGSIKDGGTCTFNGPMKLRIDHCHFVASSVNNYRIVNLNAAVYGVMDHSILDLTGTNAIYIGNGRRAAGEVQGNLEWTLPTNFGGADYFFIEDNIINGDVGGGTYSTRVYDDNTAGKVVLRFNSVSQATLGETHATGHSPDDRGLRSQEVYGNSVTSSLQRDPNFVALDMGSGTTVVWGNTWNNVYKNIYHFNVTRKNNDTYNQIPNPNGWGYAGTEFNGTGSIWDGGTVLGTDTVKGYPCLDQPGRGQGDFLTGEFPNKVNATTGTQRWPNQALEPIYMWNNVGSIVAGWGGSNYDNNTLGRVVANRDYYPSASGIQTSPTSPFNGSSGTGWGTLANRPTTCTSGVAYFATDQGSWNTSTSNPYGVQQNGASGVLYKCTAPNTWTLYYTPYTYPHPLVSGAQASPTLGNISTRSFVRTGDNVMIGGFIIQGTEPKRVIIRAIGPELTQHGVPNALADPTLELHDGTGALIASNYNWQTTHIGGIITANQVSAIRNSGYAPSQASESAIIATLPQGNYTAIVSGVNNTTGVALVDVYDLSPGASSILANISTRGFVQTGDNVMIGGFIIQGTEPKRVIIRAIGPELTQHGVPNALADPTLELHDGTGALIASNYNWQTTHIGGIITANQVSAIRNSGYAPSQASESAIIATLPQGNYTAIVSGVNNTTGVALVDVYDLQ